MEMHVRVLARKTSCLKYDFGVSYGGDGEEESERDFASTRMLNNGGNVGLNRPLGENGGAKPQNIDLRLKSLSRSRKIFRETRMPDGVLNARRQMKNI